MASPRGGGFFPQPRIPGFGQGEGLPVCQNTPSGPASPQKQNLKTSLWSSSFYPALLQGAPGALVLSLAGGHRQAVKLPAGWYSGMQGLTRPWPRGEHSRLRVPAAQPGAVPSSKAKVPEMTKAQTLQCPVPGGTAAAPREGTACTCGSVTASAAADASSGSAPRSQGCRSTKLTLGEYFSPPG